MNKIMQILVVALRIIILLSMLLTIHHIYFPPHHTINLMDYLPTLEQRL